MPAVPHPPDTGRSAGCPGEPAQGPERFQERRRADCPWCGSTRLRTRLRIPGPVHATSGAVAVDECRDCGHAFRNPHRTAEALTPHHRDLPGAHPLDGLAERLLTTPGTARRHRAAARAMLPFPEPESWLDIGTGDGRFPRAAREILPYTSFDGLDGDPGIERARAAGRIEEAHHGNLTDPEILARLRSRYDVVSMFQHLEHTPDPRAELRAALTVLRPGGHLLVEVPDPGCAFAALPGLWGAGYGRPGPLHLMPLVNLLAEVEALGCVIVTTDRREPHRPYDLSGTLALALDRALPAPDAPGPVFRGLLRSALTGAATPLVATAAVLDHTLAPLLRRTRFSNAYRVIARKAVSAA
ncbi:class I SAM-dependent methyltransferase [Streptomyces nodosus]|uniref:class I SAM-dependent methyltransferase n=1 Tax=Streptomyces nodosus TaxID=40318 RepID=UPI00382A1956